MKAIVTRLLPDKRREKVLVTDWPDPPPPTGNEIKTKTLFSGITNGTERNDLIGGNYSHPDDVLPAGWGYQNVGVIIETGPEVKNLKVGDILYLSADHTEYVVMKEDGLLIKLPEGIDPKHAALFGMASVAMRTCKNANILKGEKILVVGAGCIGQFVCQIASFMGGEVFLCDINRERLRISEKIMTVKGIIYEDNWDNILPETYDTVIDLAGVVGMEDKLINVCRQRGKVLFIAGRFHVHYTFNLAQIREITVKHNNHFTVDDLKEVCELVQKGIIKIEPLIKDIVPVNEAKRIYDTLRDEPHKLLGTVFVW